MGDKISAKVGRAGGDVITGKRVHVIKSGAAAAPPPSAAEMEDLRGAIRSLRQLVAEQAPETERAEALAQVDNLERAASEGGADLDGMARVRNWFARHLPAMAGAVFSIIVHPVIGKLVEAAGDAAVKEFGRLFGEE